MKSLIKSIVPELTTLNAFVQVEKVIFKFNFEVVMLNGVLNFPENDDLKGMALIVHGYGRTNAIA